MSNDELPNRGRRQAVIMVGSLAAAGLLGCGGGEEATPTSATTLPTTGASAGGGSCVVRPQQTEGPYFVDERLNRVDLRADPATGSLRPGVPLKLAFAVTRAGACTPLAGVLVDVWHCDALGTYSDVRDMGKDTTGQKFLRGYQLTDDAGRAEFRTIYPGWYSGRAVHIHFKLRSQPAAGIGFEFTSQLYFDEGVTDLVHAQAPYDTKGQRNTPNAADGIYRSGGSQLMPALVPDGAGYAASFDIALQV